jgi:hypothetical protein
MRDIREFPVTIDEVVGTLERAADAASRDPKTGGLLIGGVSPMILNDLARSAKERPHLLHQLLGKSASCYALEPNGDRSVLAMALPPEIVKSEDGEDNDPFGSVNTRITMFIADENESVEVARKSGETDDRAAT